MSAETYLWPGPPGHETVLKLSDNSFIPVADAWPNISSLFLNRSGPWKADSGVTPAGLIASLQRCPRLATLSIVPDFFSIDHEPQLIRWIHQSDAVIYTAETSGSSWGYRSVPCRHRA
ncbi:hypothetical protein BJ138DRAFT_1145344 [Hygrophoropsis aurantiaca]|uniref:Uncharacterized protein n=1 Tax=Hygrophoropsis aurantiaca TaxID=72124 RepID=A0ACB8AK31_9AGAM|nr:hypothetical protein BJ138DRAFT_1145344 [Hygrophoropsis aurantiaca]